jgi:hypothetical protein
MRRENHDGGTMNEAQDQIRRQLLELLLTKVEQDTYPSSTMLDLIEELLGPDEVGDYAEVLMAKVANDQFPSLDLMNRVKSLT